MIRTILYVIYFFFHVFGLIFSVLIPHFLLNALGMRSQAKALQKKAASWYGRQAILATGARVRVTGAENLPPELTGICFVANHQTYFDILAILGYITGSTGFVAKKELLRVPIISSLMVILGCVFIDRKSPRSSVEAIQAGVRSIQSGNNMVIFPEGTRSRSSQMNQFKPGSLKLAFRSGAVIVPISIDGTYRIFEEHNRIRKAEVVMTIHPPMQTGTAAEADGKGWAEKLQSRIQEGLQPGGKTSP